jgi:hypothetical protein
MDRNYKFETEPQQVKVLKGSDLVTATLVEKGQCACMFTEYCFGFRPKRQCAISTILQISKALCRAVRCSRAQIREHHPDRHKEHINAAPRDAFITLPLFHETERGRQSWQAEALKIG